MPNITLIECKDCGWRGAIAECVHTAGISFCPKCGSKNLIEILRDGAQVVPVPA